MDESEWVGEWACEAGNRVEIVGDSRISPLLLASHLSLEVDILISNDINLILTFDLCGLILKKIVKLLLK